LHDQIRRHANDREGLALPFVGQPENAGVELESTSAFIAAFSHVLGTTPGRYYKAHGAERAPTGSTAREPLRVRSR
jgi:hypothetical protein